MKVEVAVTNGIAAIMLGYCIWNMSDSTLMGVDVAGLMVLAAGVFFPTYFSKNTAMQWLLRIVGCIGLFVLAIVTYRLSNSEMI